MAIPNVGSLLSDVLRLIRKKFQQDPDIGNFTLAQAKALSVIARNEGIKQVDIAEILEIKPMTLVRVIDQLVEEGLVQRCANPLDRRSHLVKMLPAGKPQLEVFAKVSNRLWDVGFEGITIEQKEQFLKTLEHIHRNLSAN